MRDGHVVYWKFDFPRRDGVNSDWIVQVKVFVASQKRRKACTTHVTDLVAVIILYYILYIS